MRTPRGPEGEYRVTSLGSSKLERVFKCIVMIGLWLAPITSVFWGWRFRYLWPLVLYASVMPYLPLFVGIVCFMPWTLLTLVGVSERFRPAFELVLTDYFWPAYMRIMHGYEITGLENLPPKDKGALIVFYHGVVVWDVVFAAVAIHNRCKRFLEGVAHRFIFAVPIVRNILTELKFSAGSRVEMISGLKNGALMCVSPGGMYEAMFSQKYSVEFQGRCGFATVAKEANVPIIPMFTENIRESHHAHHFGIRGVLEWLCTTYKVQLYWAFGGWPVKLRTHLGTPLWAREDETAQEFALRVKKAIENLRDTHQKLDGSVTRALLERLPKNILAKTE